MTALRILFSIAALLCCCTISHPEAQPADTLLAATERGDIERVRAFAVDRAAIDARDERGRTALLVATHRNDVPIAQALISAGADVNAKDALSDSPYLYAAAEGRLEILRLTLSAGADLTSLNRYGGTGLIPAAHHGHAEVVRELLKTPIAIDHVNRLGWTALLEAIILGDGGPAHTEIVRLLVGAGANVNLTDSGGVGPLAHAERRHQGEIVEILRAAGAN
ncbi:MAG: ankyrin repeat-containing protein [Rhodospirillales bacterium]|jgi:ankyrin repeat protein|nr:ankyrin repeat-containing protein [Rhodospirillales bacterium]